MRTNDKQTGKIYLSRPLVGEEELDLIRQVIESKHLVDGPMTRKFEKTVSEYVGAKHGIATTSCTTAMEVSLRAMGVGLGDEVLVPDFTHPATALVVQMVGAEPILTDVDIDSYNINADIIKAAITDKTKCIIPVSIFGNPVDMKPINELKDKGQINIVEDAACSLGSEIDGRRVGSLTDITCFSFHPRKVFAMGDGGMITTNDDNLAEIANSMKRFGVSKIDGKGRFTRYGSNYRLSDILGAVGLGQVRKIQEIVNDRIEKAKNYDKLLKDMEHVRIPIVKPNVKHNYQTYAVYIEKEGIRDEIIREMRSRGIETQIGTYALHLEPIFAKVRRCSELSNSTRLFKNLLALPLHHELTYENQVFVCENLSMVIKKLGV